MQDRVQQLPLSFVCEDDAAESRAVKLTVRIKNFCPERFDDAPESFVPRRDNFAGRQVCVEDVAAKLREHGGDERLAHGD
jgi:hypothetical protein